MKNIFIKKHPFYQGLGPEAHVEVYMGVLIFGGLMMNLKIVLIYTQLG